METLKNQIKQLSSEQKSLKFQRKTITFKGERVMSSDEATFKVHVRKGLLRCMHVAYSLLLGNSYESIESNPKEPFTPEDLEALKDKWKGYM